MTNQKQVIVMGFLSFGSKKGKVQKMLEEGQFDLLIEEALKDKKVREALFELLSSNNPGVVGDALLTITNILERDSKLLKEYLKEENFRKLLSLVESKNPYVRENAMVLAYSVIKAYPELMKKYRPWIVEEVARSLREGDKNQKGFVLVIIGELGLKELEPDVKSLVGVEDKVILPFEGKKWVKLGDIASETLEKLS
jgi:vesicle coat complex subunit